MKKIKKSISRVTPRAVLYSDDKKEKFTLTAEREFPNNPLEREWLKCNFLYESHWVNIRCTETEITDFSLNKFSSYISEYKPYDGESFKFVITVNIEHFYFVITPFWNLLSVEIHMGSIKQSIRTNRLELFKFMKQLKKMSNLYPISSSIKKAQKENILYEKKFIKILNDPEVGKELKEVVESFVNDQKVGEIKLNQKPFLKAIYRHFRRRKNKPNSVSIARQEQYIKESYDRIKNYVIDLYINNPIWFDLEYSLLKVLKERS